MAMVSIPDTGAYSWLVWFYAWEMGALYFSPYFDRIIIIAAGDPLYSRFIIRYISFGKWFIPNIFQITSL